VAAVEAAQVAVAAVEAAQVAVAAVEAADSASCKMSRGVVLAVETVEAVEPVTHYPPSPSSLRSITTAARSPMLATL
jgi:hypothetical protein